METIKEAKEFLRANYDRGVTCPCCGQYVKLYKRKLNSGMAVALIRMYSHARLDWVNVKDFLRQHKYRNNHDWTLLRFWGIIEEDNQEGPEGAKSAGHWRITPKGHNFVLNRIRVPKRVSLYNNQFRGFDEETTSIVEALGDHFNYHELMSL